MRERKFMRGTARITGVIRSHGKGLLYAGTAAAVLGAGSASAVAMAAPADAAAVSNPSNSVFGTAASAVNVLDSAVAKAAITSVPHAAHQVPAVQIRTLRASAPQAVKPVSMSWNKIAAIVAHRADPKLGRGSLPAADQLRPVALYGQQQHMPIGSAQMHNATTIVTQALAKKMGVRSAVIAVATSMQESNLNNISYGTSDSLGLFQQRPSCGWGTPQQIMNPTHASNAFLAALQGYQANNPSWAHQPLYQTAQGVQGSAFPTAYAQWEAQASGLVQHITTTLTA
jgi:hypothetical protein